MQLQFRSEYKKYLGLQRSAGSGESRSNRLLIHGDMVKKANKENTPRRGCDNIEQLVQYIEGGAQTDVATKKQQKKARQKQKKDDERKQREEEEEALRKAEEARIRREQQVLEQQRIKDELALQKQLKKSQKKTKQTQQQQPLQQQNDSKTKKKKKQSSQVVSEPVYSCEEPELYEQTIPAMVTIKRIVENNNSPPTVTITLKGSTPDQDKLLYTLVNGHDAPIFTNTEKANGGGNSGNKNSTSSKQSEKQKKTKQKNVTNNTNTSNNGNSNKENKNIKVETSEIKVQLAIDSSFRKDLAKTQKKQLHLDMTTNKTNQQPEKQAVSKTAKKEAKKEKNKEKTKSGVGGVKTSNLSTTTSTTSSSISLNSTSDIIDIPSIKLPPGITITKVSGPLTNRKSAATQGNDYPDVPVSKSGVIVVDTEKLIHQQGTTGNTTSSTSGSSKKKKKKSKKGAGTATEGSGAQIVVKNDGSTQGQPRVTIKSNEDFTSKTGSGLITTSTSGMVTLKNPIFHPLQGMVNMNQKPTNDDASGMAMMNMNEQATISHGENGMVTIRRPRPVGYMQNNCNESSISDYLAQNASKGSTVTTNDSPPSCVVTTAPPSPHKMAATISALPVTSTNTSNTNLSNKTSNAHLKEVKSQNVKTNPPILTPWQMPDTSFSALTEERKIIRPPSPKNVQWPRSDCENGKMNTPSVLQGLPFIEITRVRPGTGSPVVEQEYVEPPANVSIIRTGGGGFARGDKTQTKPQSWAYSTQP